MTADTAVLNARVDKLTQALLHVTSELWMMRDRQAVLERVLADGGLVAADLIDAYRPDAALAERLTAEREAFVAAVLGYLAPEG